MRYVSASRFLFSAGLLLFAVSCTEMQKPAAVPPEKPKTVEPAKSAPQPQTAVKTVPETPLEAPSQYFFPHGHLGRIIIHDHYLVHAASWTRGDGVSFFDISDPKQPYYAYGLPSAGYVSGVARRGDVIYFTTGYSIMTVKMPSRNSFLKKLTRSGSGEEPRILENTLIAFPNGNVSRIVLNGNSLYVTAPDGLRQYMLAEDGRPEYSRTYRELKQLSMFAIAGEQLYFVRSNMKNNVFCSSLDHPEKTKSVWIAKAPAEKLVVGSDGQVFVLAGKKLIRFEKKEELFPGKTVRDVQQATEKTFTVRYLDGKSERLILTDGVTLYRDLTAEGLPANAVSATQDNDRTWIWTADGDICFRQTSAVGISANGKLPHIARNEAPVTVCGDYVYSIDQTGNNYVLYGYRTDQAQAEKKTCDVCISWKTVSKKSFRYDIVIPPFSLCHYGKYLFAPEAVLDVSKPAFPEVVAQINGAACAVAEGPDGILYLAQGHKLTVLNGKRLPYLEILAEIPADQTVKSWTDIASCGPYLYLNARNALIVFNMRDPAKPQKIAELSLPGQSYKIVRIGKMLYLPPYGGQNTPFRIIDISRPDAPKIAGTLPGFEGHSILGVAERNGKLYVADGIRIHRYSLTDPAKPQLERTWCGPDRAMQGYSWIDVQNGILAGKKYPRFDVWRITE